MPGFADAIRRRLQQGSQSPNIYNGQINPANLAQSPFSANTQVSTQPVAGGPVPLDPNFQSPAPGIPTPLDYSQFDPETAAVLRRIQEAELGINSDQELGLRRIGEDFANSRLNITRAGQEAGKSLAEQMADRGLTYSGINVGERGKIEQNTLRSLGDLESSGRRSIEDLIRDVTAQRNDLLKQSEDIRFEGARRQIQAELQAALAEAQKKANEELLKMQPKFSLTGTA